MAHTLTRASAPSTRRVLRNSDQNIDPSLQSPFRTDVTLHDKEMPIGESALRLRCLAFDVPHLESDRVPVDMHTDREVVE